MISYSSTLALVSGTHLTYHSYQYDLKKIRVSEHFSLRAKWRRDIKEISLVDLKKDLEKMVELEIMHLLLEHSKCSVNVYLNRISMGGQRHSIVCYGTEMQDCNVY